MSKSEGGGGAAPEFGSGGGGSGSGSAAVPSSSTTTLPTRDADTLGHVLSFLDYDSACAFVDAIASASAATENAAATANEKSGRSAADRPAFEHVWKGIFRRHGFSPAEEGGEDGGGRTDRATTTTTTTSSSTTREEIGYRRRLVKNLLGGGAGGSRNRRRSNSSLASLRHSMFRFLPIAPLVEGEDGEDFDGEDFVVHVPPVNYECDSFLLTSAATSGEFAFLDPFSGTLSVRSSVLDGATNGGGDSCDYDYDGSLERWRARNAAFEEEGGKKPPPPEGGIRADSAAVESESPPDLGDGGRHQQQRSRQEFLLSLDDHWDLPLREYGFRGNGDRGGGAMGRQPPQLPRRRAAFFDDDDVDDDDDSIGTEDSDDEEEGGDRRRRRRHRHRDDDSLEVEIGNLGVECRQVFYPEPSTPAAAKVPSVPATSTAETASSSTLVAIARRVTNVDDDRDYVVEVLAWMRHKCRCGGDGNSFASGIATFADRRVVRFRHDFWSMELALLLPSPSHSPTLNDASAGVEGRAVPKLFVNLDPQQEIHQRRNHHDRQEDNIEALLEAGISAGSSRIAIYPLVPYLKTPQRLLQPAREHRGEGEEAGTTPAAYFPEPDVILDCQEPVTTMATSCAATALEGSAEPDQHHRQQQQMLLVGTAHGKLQLWGVNLSPDGSKVAEARLLESIPVQRELGLAFERAILAPPHNVSGSSRQQRLPPINSIHVPPPQGMPLDQSGFVTLHRSRAHGSVVLLWKKSRCVDRGDSEEGKGESKSSFQVASMINLPLAYWRTPEFHYDGRRLVVFGQDHIGALLLVYQVWNPDDADAFPETAATSSCAASSNGAASCASDDGGVFHLTPSPEPHQLRLANVVRHAALGGFDPSENLRMTCNERFIIVNTKEGNFLNDSQGRHSYSEGLLIIDLNDNEKY